MSIIPNAYLRNERLASAIYEGKMTSSLLAARAVVAVARLAITEAVNETIERSDALVNAEVSNVSGDQQKRRAFLTEADRAELVEAIMQAIDDHYFLPINLMSKEAGEE